MAVHDNYFSTDYAEAREKFGRAAAGCGLKVEAHVHPEKGPKGEELAVEVARFGAEDAAKIMVVQSATHGVEGFCGSGVQVGLLQDGAFMKYARGVAVLFVHAINPYGFAWLSRTTHENVDLNRNFADFAKPLPENPGYDALKDEIAPKSWTPEAIAASTKALSAYAAKNGAMALQAALSIGQYRHADGIFYGGSAPTWSRKVLETVIAKHCRNAKKAALIDLHTGLGPYGYGEAICVVPPTDPAYARARAWYGDSVTSPEGGTSTSAAVRNHMGEGYAAMLPQAELTVVALEYGTYSMSDVMTSLRADNWLRFHGDRNSPQGQEIKKQIRRAFYPDKDDWRELVWYRGRQVVRQGLSALAQA
jgi:hypothetical protein